MTTQDKTPLTASQRSIKARAAKVAAGLKRHEFWYAHTDDRDAIMRHAERLLKRRAVVALRDKVNK